MKKRKSRLKPEKQWDFERQSFARADRQTVFFERCGAFLSGLSMLTVLGLLASGYKEAYDLSFSPSLIYGLVPLLAAAGGFACANVRAGLICPIGGKRFLLLLSLPLTAFGLFLMPMLPVKGAAGWAVLSDALFLVLAYPLFLAGNIRKGTLYAGMAVAAGLFFKVPLPMERRGWILFLCAGAAAMDLGILMQFVFSVPAKMEEERWHFSGRSISVKEWGFLSVQSLMPIAVSMILRGLR